MNFVDVQINGNERTKAHLIKRALQPVLDVQTFGAALVRIGEANKVCAAITVAPLQL